MGAITLKFFELKVQMKSNYVQTTNMNYHICHDVEKGTGGTNIIVDFNVYIPMNSHASWTIQFYL